MSAIATRKSLVWSTDNPEWTDYFGPKINIFSNGELFISGEKILLPSDIKGHSEIHVSKESAGLNGAKICRAKLKYIWDSPTFRFVAMPDGSSFWELESEPK